MNIEDLPDGFKIALNKDEVYSYDKKNKKWMLGKKEASKESASMLEYIAKQIEEPQGERVENVDVEVSGKTVKDEPGEVVKSGKTLPKIIDTGRAGEDKPTVSPAELAEEKKKLLEEIKSKIEDRDTLRKEAKEKKEEPNKRAIAVKIANVAEVAKAITDSIMGRGGVKGTVYGGSGSAVATAAGAAAGAAATVSDDPLKSLRARPSDFQPKYGGRESLDKLSDLTPGERELLNRRGVAPASEKDFSYRKDGRVLNKQQILEELDESYNENPLKRGFKGRLREKLPYLRFFTNRLETPEDIAKGNAPRQQIGRAFESLKSTKAYQKMSESTPFRKASEAIGGVRERVKEGVKTRSAQAVEAGKNIFRPRGGAAAAAEEVMEEAAESRAGPRTSKIAMRAKQGAEKIKSFFSPKAAASEVAEEAAEKAAAKGGAKAAGKGLGKSILKKIPGVSILAGLAFGAGRLMKGDLLGAAGEVGSGIAGTVPGVGTAASVGIDAALAARDMSNQDDAQRVSENAKGNVFNKIQMFKDGGVVNKATPFMHSEGAGIMGEAGPEAIMPLQKTPDGRLGVEMVNKDALSKQTQELKTADEEIEKKTTTQQQAAAPTIINTNTTNNMRGGGDSGMTRAPTSAPRGSLATNYFAF